MVSLFLDTKKIKKLKGYPKLMEFLILKPSINLTLKNRENLKPFDVCKPDFKSYFEKVLIRKKKNSEFNSDIVIHNANFPKQANKVNASVRYEK